MNNLSVAQCYSPHSSLSISVLFFLSHHISSYFYPSVPAVLFMLWYSMKQQKPKLAAVVDFSTNKKRVKDRGWQKHSDSSCKWGSDLYFCSLKKFDFKTNKWKRLGNLNKPGDYHKFINPTLCTVQKPFNKIRGHCLPINCIFEFLLH